MPAINVLPDSTAETVVPSIIQQAVIIAPHNKKEVCVALTRDLEPCQHPAKWDVGNLSLCGVHKRSYHKGTLVLTPVSGDQTLRSPNESAGNNHHINKEDTVDNNGYIYEFLTEYTISLRDNGTIERSALVHRITTNPTAEQKERYIKSLLTHKPVQNLLAVSNGEHQRHLLVRAARKGVEFNISMFKNQDFKAIDPAKTSEWFNRCSFALANDSHTVLVEHNGGSWGLEPFGIVTKDCPKLMKRTSELLRLSEMALEIKDPTKFNVVEFDPTTHLPPKFHDEMFWDGTMFVSPKFVRRHIAAVEDPKRRKRLYAQATDGTHARGSIRITTPNGLFKGHFIMDPNQVEDVIYHGSGLKAEWASVGFVLSTIEWYKPYHEAVWDNQTMINNKAFLPEAKHNADLATMVKETLDDFGAGTVPDWLLLGEELMGGDDTPNYERLSEMLDRQYIRWQAHGLDIHLAQNLVYMAWGGIDKKMTRDLRPATDYNPRYYKKAWILMTNAFMGAVCTYESLTMMGKITLADDGEYISWSPLHGLVIPGKRFIETYKLHGGWDLDDAVKVILIKIWCADQERVQALKDSGALDPRIDVPTTKEEAIPVALLLRSPNGPGEWSIEALRPGTDYGDMPWYKLEEGRINPVDLSTAPDPQPMLLAQTVLGTIPTSLVHTGTPFSKAQAWDTINAQMINPGIGGIVSALMHWVMAFGPSFPPKLLAALEQMVDTTQQLHDIVSFEAINNEINDIYEQLCARLEAEGGQVDALFLYAYPIPEAFVERLAPFAKQGRFSRMSARYDTQVALIRERVRDTSMELRQQHPIAHGVMNLNVTSDTTKWARKFYSKFTAELKQNDSDWSPNRWEKMNPFAKMHFEVQRTKANKRTVASMVEELRAFGGVDTYKRVLSLWKYILDNRMVDRILFQPGDDVSVMDILLEALIWRGIATPISVAE